MWSTVTGPSHAYVSVIYRPRSKGAADEAPVRSAGPGGEPPRAPEPRVSAGELPAKVKAKARDTGRPAVVRLGCRGDRLLIDPVTLCHVKFRNKKESEAAPLSLEPIPPSCDPVLKRPSTPRPSSAPQSLRWLRLLQPFSPRQKLQHSPNP